MKKNVLDGIRMICLKFMILISGLEYVWNVLLRIYKIYEGVGRFGQRFPSRGDFYQAMINSSMICWMDLDSDHLEFRNLRMPYKQTETVDIPYCRIELDHEVKILFMLIC